MPSLNLNSNILAISIKSPVKIVTIIFDFIVELANFFINRPEFLLINNYLLNIINKYDILQQNLIHSPR